MFFGSVATKSLRSNLKLVGGIAKSDEWKAPEQDTNRLSRKLLQSTNINCLWIISQPVTKVDTLDVELAELVVGTCSNDEFCEDTLDITMAIVDVVDGRNVDNVALKVWN